MEIDEWSQTQVENMAKEIRKKALDARIYNIVVDEFTLKHPDVALVCAYWLGTLDNTTQWKKSIWDILKEKE